MLVAEAKAASAVVDAFLNSTAHVAIPSYVQAMKQLQFSGASGFVQFQKKEQDDNDANGTEKSPKYKGDRDPTDLIFGFHNVRPILQPNGKRKCVRCFGWRIAASTRFLILLLPLGCLVGMNSSW